MEVINFAEPDIREGDIFAVTDLLRGSKRLTDGDQCRKFERDFRLYTGAEYALTTSSCMSALVLAYMALGIGKGDEVICTAMSHVATAHAIEMVGATPVFVDCDSFGNIEHNSIKPIITRKTKAIAIVHYLGFACDMDWIMGIAENYGLEVIEDCALAMGTKFNDNHVGTFGYGTFSFYPCKHLTTCEGGMFTTKNKEVYEKAKTISSFGKLGGGYNYDIKYLGSNFRMSEMQAVLGRQQLKRIGEYKQKRVNNFIKYAELDEYFIGGFVKSASPYCYKMKFRSEEKRDGAMGKLNINNIGFSIYYPHPIPRLEYYREKYGYKKVWFKNAEAIADTTLALPVGPHITEEDIERIVKICRK